MKIDWKKILAVVGGLVILAGVAYAAYFLKLENDYDRNRICCGNGTSAVAGDISEWKTYRDEKFEFQYPKEFSLKTDNSNDGSVLLLYKAEGKNDNPVIGALEIQREGKITYKLQDYCSQNKQVDFCRTGPVPDSDASYSDSNKGISFNGYEAIYFSMVGIGEDSLYLVKSLGGEVLSIRVEDNTYGQDVNVKEFYEKLDQLLSTFKFIEPEVDMSGWRVYKNEKLGYSINYPSGYFVRDSGDNGNCFSDSTSETPGFSLCIAVFDRPTNTNLLRWWGDVDGFERLTQDGTIKVAGEDALIFRLPNTVIGRQILFDKDERIFLISGTSPFEEDMFSSMKIFEPSVVDIESNWKIFASQRYGFMFRYPSNWKVISTFTSSSPSFAGLGPDFGLDLSDPDIQKIGFGVSPIDTSLFVEYIGEIEPNESFEKALERLGPLNVDFSKRERVWVDGEEGWFYKEVLPLDRLVQGAKNFNEIFVGKKGRLYGIAQFAISDTTFKTIVSTFRFLP